MSQAADETYQRAEMWANDFGDGEEVSGEDIIEAVLEDLDLDALAADLGHDYAEEVDSADLAGSDLDAEEGPEVAKLRLGVRAILDALDLNGAWSELGYPTT